MRKYRLGFVGCGNMGAAMLAGALEKNWTSAEQIVVHTHSTQKMEALAAQYGIQLADSNAQVAQQADIVVLAVKPNIYEQVLEEMKSEFSEGQIVLAIAPAYSIEAVAKIVNHDGVRIARAMPNTPAQIGKGMAGLCFSDNTTDEERALMLSFFEAFGKVAVVREDTMHAVGSVSGSSPAFVYMVIEAMAEGAIKLGIPAKDAYTFAAQSVYGAAALVLESGAHPAVLRDAVCSAGGTTIEGVAVLEKEGLKGALIDAMNASSEKFLAMEAAAKK